MLLMSYACTGNYSRPEALTGHNERNRHPSDAVDSKRPKAAYPDDALQEGEGLVDGGVSIKTHAGLELVMQHSLQAMH